TGKHPAVVNLFRNTVNNVRKMSTSPVRRVTTASGKSKKTVNQNQEKTPGVTALQFKKYAIPILGGAALILSENH
ncbi:MAG: hypothetical protein IK126_02985, partial [Bacteroidales bacterium]|nr:hypothetical protein [Bacteroidales bacterium]